MLCLPKNETIISYYLKNGYYHPITFDDIKQAENFTYRIDPNLITEDPWNEFGACIYNNINLDIYRLMFDGTRCYYIDHLPTDVVMDSIIGYFNIYIWPQFIENKMDYIDKKKVFRTIINDYIHTGVDGWNKDIWYMNTLELSNKIF